DRAAHVDARPHGAGRGLRATSLRGRGGAAWTTSEGRRQVMSEQQEFELGREHDVDGDHETQAAMPPVEGSLALALAEATEEQADDDEKGRRKRRNRSRARTISIRRLSKAELNRGKALYPETD